ncbi:SRPBCC family protein [Streptosporangium sp. NPDC048047]|uniref:SRPBCC family protein n=1 Tax=Streptosporangium sp. NPDC048047 TaxID=3155748 RepID=UPI00341637B6
MSETLAADGDRTVLRMERRLGHPPEKVWRAVTDPAHLAEWFPARVEADLRAGGRIGFDLGGGHPPVDGVVTEFDPPRAIAYTWGDDLLRWEVRPQGDGSLLVLTHTFADRFGAASFAAGWRMSTGTLTQILGGGPATAPGRAEDLHEALVARFGLDEGTSEDVPGGWRVRFERQLVRPAERVWAELHPDAVPAPGDAVPPGFTVPEFAPGTVTEVRVPALLEYGWHRGDRPAGTVRWELGPGTGHGARLVVTQTGPHDLPGARVAALTAWRAHIADLAKRLLDTAP